MAKGKISGSLSEKDMAELQTHADKNNAAADDNGKKKTLSKEERAASRRPNFVRLAPRRVNAALKRIVALGYFSNKAQYEMTEEEAAKIISALVSAVSDVADKLRGVTKKEEEWTL